MVVVTLGCLVVVLHPETTNAANKTDVAISDFFIVKSIGYRLEMILYTQLSKVIAYKKSIIFSSFFLLLA